MPSNLPASALPDIEATMKQAKIMPAVAKEGYFIKKFKSNFTALMSLRLDSNIKKAISLTFSILQHLHVTYGKQLANFKWCLLGRAYAKLAK